MAKIVVLYTRPDDVEEFDEHYRTAHMPLASTVPGASWELVRITGTPRGGEPPFHLMAVASFASEEAMREALSSPEMRQTGRDAAQMVQRFGIEATMLLGTEDA